MEGSLNAVHVTSRKFNSGILSFSYFRTTEQNRHSFVQFDSQKIEKHLLKLESCYKIAPKSVQADTHIKSDTVFAVQPVLQYAHSYLLPCIFSHLPAYRLHLML